MSEVFVIEKLSINQHALKYFRLGNSSRISPVVRPMTWKEISIINGDKNTALEYFKPFEKREGYRLKNRYSNEIVRISHD